VATRQSEVGWGEARAAQSKGTEPGASLKTRGVALLGSPHPPIGSFVDT